MAHKKGITPALDRAREVIRPLLQAGLPVGRKSISEKFGISQGTVQDAVNRELGFLEGQRNTIVRRDDLTPSAQKKFDSALSQAKRKQESELERQFEERVLAECKLRIEEQILPAYRKDLVDAAETLRSRKGILPLATFKKILSCLHPDRVGAELQKRYQESFTAFAALERVIVSEVEMPTPAIDFPRTWAEMQARKQDMRTQKRSGGLSRAG